MFFNVSWLCEMRLDNVTTKPVWSIGLQVYTSSEVKKYTLGDEYKDFDLIVIEFTRKPGSVDEIDVSDLEIEICVKPGKFC